MSATVKEPPAAEIAVETGYSGLAHVKSIVAFASAKGGTGKSTILTNVAAALALKGRKIGIADADLDAPSVAPMLGLPHVRLISTGGVVEPAGGPLGIRIVANDPSADHPLVSFADDDLHLGSGASPDADEVPRFTSLEDLIGSTRFGALDLLLVDLPPGFKHAVRLCELIGRAGVVIVLPASAAAAAAVRRSLEQARRKGVRVVGLIENMQGFYCGNCHSVRPLLPRADLGTLARDFDVPILGRVPFDSRLAESCDNGRPFVREYPDAPVSKLMNETAQALLAAVSVPHPAPRA
jgi:ATP-binding protein involved in chromosome partitioning